MCLERQLTKYNLITSFRVYNFIFTINPVEASSGRVMVAGVVSRFRARVNCIITASISYNKTTRIHFDFNLHSCSEGDLENSNIFLGKRTGVLEWLSSSSINTVHRGATVCWIYLHLMKKYRWAN